MASNTRNDAIWSRISAPSVLLVITALFAGFFVAPSFESARPRSPVLTFDPARQAGRARGLITLDPLEQAYLEIGSYKAGEEPWGASASGHERFSIETLVAELLAGIDVAAPGAEGRALLLLNSVRGGGLSEDHERRLRGRYATAAALVRENLFPRDSKRLQMFWMPSPGGAPQAPGVLVPYEFFDAGAQSTSPYRRVAVCWVDEAAIEAAPLPFALEMIDRAKEAARSRTGGQPVHRLDVRWVGPTTSGRLRQLLNGATALNDDQRALPLKIVTPYATSPKVEIKDLAAWNCEGIGIRRSVGTDDRLARLLVNELMLRVPTLMPMQEERWGKGGSGAGESRAADASPPWLRALCYPLRVINFAPNVVGDGPGDPRDTVRVALITEQDSTYGQAWVANMCEARDLLAAQHPQLANIEFTVFPLFGWVDGLLRDKDSASAATNLSKDYPAEAHQLDYLGRLREDLQAEGRFAAIGVFVTEEYDTVMVLEAVRPRFPGALFFTTDLDARYLHPRHAPFTRNLIVASHFGLSPEDPSEGGARVIQAAPEFRDGYQTGVYRTVRDLVLDREPLPPKYDSIYEVGRSQFVRLNSSAGDLLAAAPAVAPRVTPDTSVPMAAERLAQVVLDLGGASVEASERTERGGAEHGQPGVYIALLVSIALFVFAVLAYSVRPRPAKALRLSADVRTLRSFAAVVLVLLALTVLLGEAMLLQRSYPAEPMFLAEGVSAWPTIALRAVMIAISIYGLFSIPAALRRAHAKILLEYRLDPDAQPVSAAWVVDWAAFSELRAGAPGLAGAPLSRRLWTAVATLLGLRRAAPFPRARLDSVWRFVGDKLRPRRFTPPRAFYYGVAFFFMLAPFFRVFASPIGPVRGEFAYLIERLSLFASIIAFLVLLMTVMEATLFANRLIGRIVDFDLVELPAHCREGFLERKARLVLARRVAKDVEGLIWSPMIVLGLMIAARASVLDAWAWPTVLMCVFGLFFAMFLACIVSMRRVCDSARRFALEQLSDARVHAADDPKTLGLLNELMEDIAAFTGGAFSPLLQHPMVRAMLLPLAAFGANFVFERNMLEQLLGSM